MCLGLSDFSTITCPHLKGSRNGAKCEIVKDYVRNIEEVSIKVCMSKRFEICHVYRYDIKRDNIGFDQYSMDHGMADQDCHFDEKREHPRSSVCRKLRFAVSADIYRGLIGDISCGGISIISKHKLVRGSVVDIEIPPMSGTIQYCIPYGKDFFKTGLRLLENNQTPR